MLSYKSKAQTLVASLQRGPPTTTKFFPSLYVYAALRIKRWSLLSLLLNTGCPVTAFTNRWKWICCSGTSESRPERTGYLLSLFLGILLLRTQLLWWEKPKPHGEIMWIRAKTLQLTAATEPASTTIDVNESSNPKRFWSLNKT